MWLQPAALWVGPLLWQLKEQICSETHCASCVILMPHLCITVTCLVWWRMPHVLSRESGWTPTCKIQSSLVNLSDWKTEGGSLAFSSGKKLRCKTTLLQSLSTLSSLRMDPGGHPLMFMSVLCTYLACFTYKGQMTWVPQQIQSPGQSVHEQRPFDICAVSPGLFACALQGSLVQAGPSCNKLQQHVSAFQSQALRNRPIFEIHNAIHRVNFSSSVPCLGQAKFLRVVMWGFFFLFVLFGLFYSLRQLMWVIDWPFCFSADLIGFVWPKWSQSLVEVFEGLC